MQRLSRSIETAILSPVDRREHIALSLEYAAARIREHGVASGSLTVGREAGTRRLTYNFEAVLNEDLENVRDDGS